jgi:hypothetical protein
MTRVPVSRACQAMAALATWALSSCVAAPGSQPARTAYRPKCRLPAPERVDAHIPASLAADWAPPQPLNPPLNTPCSEDAIEISTDGLSLYVLFSSLPPGSTDSSQLLAAPNGTYRFERHGGPRDFANPVFYNLGQGSPASLDGELSFSPDGSSVFFHSLRCENLGYQAQPPTDDFLDIYQAPIIDGWPGPGRNLGPPVNSVYRDGEQAIHPDGKRLFLTSKRPGGLGAGDIWVSSFSDGAWGNPVNQGTPINSSADDLQPAFSSDGATMYFVSNRDPALGMAIYRSHWDGRNWSQPQPVMGGIAGEPSLTADGSLLYFVHVLTDSAGVFDANVWVSQRLP